MALANGSFTVWPVDSLEKVFRMAEPLGAESVEIEACRNEFVSAQIAVRASRALPDLRVAVSPLTHAETGAAGLEASARFVGYVPISKNTPDTPTEELDCAAPCFVPDPLLLDETITVDADCTQPVWLTIFVPPDALAGQWRGAALIAAGQERIELPITLTVHPISLPSDRHLHVTNWINREGFARHYHTEMYSPRFWQVVESYARNVAAHHQNVIPCWEWPRIFQESDGKLSFDYSDYDRWIETFMRAGCGALIEGGGFARRGLGKWDVPWFEWREPNIRRRDGARVRLDPQTVIQQLVHSLVRHMKERGWHDRFIMHVVDEPAPHTEADYKTKSRLVHEWALDVPYIEAMSLLDARGYLDIWVPNLDHFDRHRDHYLGLRDQSGFQLWFYTCMYPTGRYPNRFLDFSLLKTRILHWINWRYHLTGYLHWGLNYWTDDPFHQDRIRDGLPPGDCWIVYPGPDGPIESLRWEQMREGLQDFELLWLLDQRSKETGRALGEALGRPAGQADRICADLVPDPLTYARHPARLRAARRALIKAILSLSGDLSALTP
jgi:hypothetical protein